MAVYPTFDVDQVASFSGRAAETYNEDYMETALDQATLLFKLGTCLTEFPDDPDQAKLAQYAIIAMADTIVLQQKYQEQAASPFSSESLGSYSYSKQATEKILAGDPTGVLWFDLAVSRLGVCDVADGVPDGGGIEVFEWDGYLVPGVMPGNKRLLSPDEWDRLNGVQHEPGLPIISKN